MSCGMRPLHPADTYPRTRVPSESAAVPLERDGLSAATQIDISEKSAAFELRVVTIRLDLPTGLAPRVSSRPVTITDAPSRPSTVRRRCPSRRCTGEQRLLVLQTHSRNALSVGTNNPLWLAPTVKRMASVIQYKVRQDRLVSQREASTLLIAGSALPPCTAGDVVVWARLVF